MASRCGEPVGGGGSSSAVWPSYGEVGLETQIAACRRVPPGAVPGTVKVMPMVWLPCFFSQVRFPDCAIGEEWVLGAHFEKLGQTM
ncbi:hypothetical protein GW17_00018645 [Ensete ventricosum]|nr:hypothetical protein GW17_00018645 [Ensete ventricosum]